MSSSKRQPKTLAEVRERLEAERRRSSKALAGYRNAQQSVKSLEAMEAALVAAGADDRDAEAARAEAEAQARIDAAEEAAKSALSRVKAAESEAARAAMDAEAAERRAEAAERRAEAAEAEAAKVKATLEEAEGLLCDLGVRSYGKRKRLVPMRFGAEPVPHTMRADA